MTRSRNCGGFIWAKGPNDFLKVAEEKGWQEALKGVQEKKSPDKLQEALAPNRLAWLNLVDIKPSTRVLDVGAGTGGIACQLASRCSVVAVDGSWVDVEFLKIRAKQDGLKKFEAVIANAQNLPFEKAEFDLVVMNGVLEWVATSSESKGNPEEKQLQVLKEVRRVLKPNGKFLLGIENRYYLGYFLGIPEPHVNIRYISIINRQQAEQLSQDTRHLPFLEYTHSRKGYEDLIGKAGFSHTETYWLYPDYRLPQYIVPLGEDAIVKFFVDNLLKPESPTNPIPYSVYQFYKNCDPKIIGDFVGHYGFLSY